MGCYATYEAGLIDGPDFECTQSTTVEAITIPNCGWAVIERMTVSCLREPSMLENVPGPG